MADLSLNVVAFDLDGTLADTAPDLTAALNHALGKLGRRSIPEEEVRHLVGHGARALLRRGLAATGTSSEEVVAEALPAFLDFYGNNICEGTRPYDGVDEALTELSGLGVALAVCTNKPEALTLKLLGTLGWTTRFASIVGAGTVPFRKPDPAPLFEAVRRAGGGRAAFVGDSIVDADTARAAGIPMIAVSFGFSDRPVDQLGADGIIDHFSALLPALCAL